jgi:hypothetical protein
MSIVDHNGRPVAYGWNDIAAQEKFEGDRTLRLIPDEEFERCFPQVVRGQSGGAREQDDEGGRTAAGQSE